MTDRPLPPELLRQALVLSSQPTVIADAQGRTVFVNPAAARRLDVVMNDDAPPSLADLDAGWQVQDLSAGEERWKVASVPLPDADLWPEHSDRLMMLGTLLTAIGHEANNPSHVVALSTPLLKQAWREAMALIPEADKVAATLSGLPLEDMEREVPAIVERIEVSLQRLSSLLKEIQRFSQAEAKDDVVDLDDIIEGAMVLARTALKKRGATVVPQPDDPGLQLRVPRRTLEQALLHLILNYADHGTRLVVVSGASATHTTVSVTRTGEGPFPEQCADLRFARYAAERCGGVLQLSAQEARLTFPRMEP